jgi:uncharacterized ferritin-like protein (DUF455 family)
MISEGGPKMNIDEYCQRILFGDSMADKLVAACSFEDAVRRPLVRRPELPGRPAELKMVFRQSARPKAFPRVEELGNEGVRGDVLHFFANHELLALELMALALLRFQSAPAPFRSGLAKIMVEEQRHLRRYLQRMQELGVTFGSIEVSPFFWKCLADVDEPLAFLAGMSLTLEQANLDFARFYGEAFAQVGDASTSELLKEVYRDELGHVRHGLHWFRQWKDPELDDYVAHARALRWPLTLARAKGNAYFADARVAAGFDDDYVRRLEVSVATRGRPPYVWIFNPSAELENRQGRGYAESKLARQIRVDLTGLIGFLAADDDVLIAERPFTTAFLRESSEVGCSIPSVILLPADRPIHGNELPFPKLAGLRPWGLSPVIDWRFSDLREKIASPEEADWCTRGRNVSHVGSKLYAHTWAQEWLAQRCPSDFAASRLNSTVDLGQVVASDADIDDYLQVCSERGHSEFVLKTGWGRSGSGMLRLHRASLDGDDRRWAQGVLRNGALLVEPWLDKEADYSCRAWIGRDGSIEVKSLGRFLTDRRGSYLGAILGGVAAAADARLARFIRGDGKDPHWLARLFDELCAWLAPRLHALGYSGPLGIDAFIYRDPRSGEQRIRPLVEINPRYTMGFVADRLERAIAPGCVGVWVFVRQRDLDHVRPGTTLLGYADELRALHPRVLAATSGGPKIRSGAWITVDLNADSVVAPVLVVDRTFQAAARHLGAVGGYLAARIGNAPFLRAEG